MVLLELKVKFELENLTNLTPQGGADHTYTFKVKCGNCGLISEKHSSVTPSEEYDMPKSRGKAHLVQKCKMCSRVGTISLMEGFGKPYTLEDSEAGKFVSLARFDCRGIEPVEFSPGEPWMAEGPSGTKFTDIDLSEEEFAEYDEKASLSVGIYKFEHHFDVTK